MPTYRRRGLIWRAELYKQGKRESQSFRTKAEAVAWATQREAELCGRRLPDHTLKEALDKFADEVAPTRRGARWEETRCRAMARLPVAKKRIADVTATDLAEWRDARLRPPKGSTAKPVMTSTVRREMNLLAAVFRIARKEWKWIDASPLVDVDKPPQPPSRRRRISQDEIDRLTLALGYDGGPPQTLSDRVALAFLLAIETAMRAGEIGGLTWDKVGEKSVELPQTKNGDVRHVPLSQRAREILALMPKTNCSVFQMEPGSRDALFRKARARAELVNLHFHDSRAEAIWRLSKKLDVLELARVIGHRDLRSLMLYYQTSADDLADRLG